MCPKMANEDRELTLFEPESNLHYTLIVSNADYYKAITDERFANLLLQHAKSEEENKTGTRTEIESDMEFDIETASKETDSSCTKQAYTWKHNQVSALIQSMATHIEDLDNPRKRKDVYENVSNDLQSIKFEVNSTMVQNKWKSLVKSYRKAQDNKKRTGRGSSRFQFFDDLDNILGKNPTNACTHSINSNQSEPLATNIDKSDDGYVKDNPIQEDVVQENVIQKGVIQKRAAPANAVKTNTEHDNIKRRISEKKLKEEYIAMKKEEYAKRDQRHKDKIAIEQRKMDLFERYLNLRNN